MKKALECALILTRKHQLLGDKIALSTDYLKKIELKDKQAEINKQMIANQKQESPNSLTISNTEVNPSPNYAMEMAQPFPGNIQSTGMM